MSSCLLVTQSLEKLCFPAIGQAERPLCKVQHLLEAIRRRGKRSSPDCSETVAIVAEVRGYCDFYLALGNDYCTTVISAHVREGRPRPDD